MCPHILWALAYISLNPSVIVIIEKYIARKSTSDQDKLPPCRSINRLFTIEGDISPQIK